MGILQVLERALKFCIGLCQSGFGMPTGPRASSRRKRTAERALVPFCCWGPQEAGRDPLGPANDQSHGPGAVTAVCT